MKTRMIMIAMVKTISTVYSAEEVNRIHQTNTWNACYKPIHRRPVVAGKNEGKALT